MRSKLIRLGILITISMFIFVWGLSYLKGNDIFNRNKEYHIIYNRVDGLTQSNDVLLSGYKIGHVSNMQFLPDQSGRLLVSILIDASVNIPINSTAQLVSSDIMGSRVIKIVLSNQSRFYEANDTIIGDVEADLAEQVSMQVLPLKNKAEELLGNLDSAITGLAFIFDDNAQRNFAESFENINRSVSHIERTTADLQELISLEKENIRGIINNMNTFTGTLSQNAPRFENTLQNISDLSDNLAQVEISPLVNNLTSTTEQLNTLLSQLEMTDNTLGSLLNDDQLYHSLNDLTENMNLLMRDLRINPERYLNFSALNLGRNVYVNPSEDKAENLIFKIHLVSSQNKIPLDSKNFEDFDEIEEYEVSGVHTYLYGSFTSFEKAREMQEKAQVRFPDASIVAFRNGRLIKLERALRSLK